MITQYRLENVAAIEKLIGFKNNKFYASYGRTDMTFNFFVCYYKIVRNKIQKCRWEPHLHRHQKPTACPQKDQTVST